MRIERANGGGYRCNFSGALLAEFELVLMAKTMQGASWSTEQALRGHHITDSVRTPLAPRSHPTAALLKLDVSSHHLYVTIAHRRPSCQNSVMTIAHRRPSCQNFVMTIAHHSPS